MRRVSRSGIGALSLSETTLAAEFIDGEDARKMFGAARTDANAALTIDPRNAAAHRALALVFNWGDLDWNQTRSSTGERCSSRLPMPTRRSITHRPSLRLAACVFTKDLKLGVLWRVLLVWFGGRVVSAILLNQADSDLSMALLLLVSIVLVVVVALYVGLRFGWRSADNMLTSTVPATASL